MLHITVMVNEVNRVKLFFDVTPVFNGVTPSSQKKLSFSRIEVVAAPSSRVNQVQVEDQAA